MGNGKRGVAPCGHPGEAVIGQFYVCLQGCDDTSDFDFWDEVTAEHLVCPQCGSNDVDDEFTLGAMFLFYNPTHPIYDTRCNSCGRCWAR